VEQVPVKVEEQVDSPWDLDEEPIVQRRESKKVKEDTRDGAKSFWKPEQLE
jgi:hypothetical protein